MVFTDIITILRTRAGYKLGKFNTYMFLEKYIPLLRAEGTIRVTDGKGCKNMDKRIFNVEDKYGVVYTLKVVRYVPKVT